MRIESAAGRLVRLDIGLEAGLSLCEAIGRPLERAGFRSAAVVLDEVRFDPFRYVTPAFSRDADHVAFYSDTFAPEGEVGLQFGTATYGRRDGGAFIHCHAVWEEAGAERGGHILPFEAMVSAPGRAVAFGTADVGMEAVFDPETNFTLFGPVGAGVPGGGLIVARIRPGEDFVGGIEAICRAHGVRDAVIRSGVGSIAGARFEDGTVVETLPTEIVVTEGRVSAGVASVEVALADVRGAVHRGRPVRGANPVLILMELFLEVG